MNALLRKEMRLSALILTFLFIAFGFMALLPGYPILCGVFFITLGIYQSFQSAREANDIVYTALLPVAKSDVVKGKFQFVIFIELCGFIVMTICTLVRMTIFFDSQVYRNNALMNANFFFLGTVLILFGLFNVIFVGGFFKTGYKIGKSFILYMIAAFITIGIAETLHHIPGLEALNAFGFDEIILQVILLLSGIVVFFFMTYLAFRKATKDFEKIDL